MGLTYGDVCSGIGAASVAWQALDWKCVYHAEIEKYASMVLAKHYPDTVNYGDFTKIQGDKINADLIIGGTPCQAFSLAGWRKGMGEYRGNLALEYTRLIDRSRPTWIIWENVPGVLSSNSGRDFGSLIGALAELGYSYSWRVLDAQYFGVPQQRKRLFLVGHIRDWRYPAAVLFERHSLQRHFAPGSEDAPNHGYSLIRDTFRLQGFGNYTRSQVAGPIKARDYKSPTDLVVCHIVPQSIRRLTITELERLQGFPDDYTYVGKKALEPRYRVLGNTIAVPVLRWIGERIHDIQMVSEGSSRCDAQGQ